MCTYTVAKNYYLRIDSLRSNVEVLPAQSLQQPGKIYFKDNFIFINEYKEGIHIINNADPSNPQKVGFIKIPGNVDIAAFGNVLYADSYMDLLSIDISNPAQPQILNRVEDVFLDFYRHFDPAQVMSIIETRTEVVTEKCDCGEENSRPDIGIGFPIWRTFEAAAFNIRTNSAPSSAPSAGVGGSMARFTIAQGFLYTVGTSKMNLFEISNPALPQFNSTLNLPWGIETIFPYQNKLFLGANNGMHIYDIENPATPTHLSTYAHVLACDPVVVEGNKAYVTLREDNFCMQGQNLLEVIDISNPRSPTLLKSYPMQHPHGLGIDNGTLFLCEGRFGLKVFDASSPYAIDRNLLRHFTGFHAFDVIPLGNLLLMIGEDGLYQYDYSNPQSLRLLSKITIGN